MKNDIASFIAWGPTFILIFAATLQLLKIILTKNIEGISSSSWFLFGVANIWVYFYVNRLFEMQSLVGLFCAGIIDFIIAYLAFTKYGKQKKKIKGIKLNKKTATKNPKKE
jgi:hypothetical protein